MLVAAALGLFAVWSNSFIAIGYLLGSDGVAPRFDWVGLTVARFLFAGALCLAYLGLARRAESWDVLRRYWKRLLVCGALMVFRDGSARKQADAALLAERSRLAQQFRRQASLATIELSINQISELRTLLDRISRMTEQLLPSDGACVVSGAWVVSGACVVAGASEVDGNSPPPSPVVGVVVLSHAAIANAIATTAITSIQRILRRIRHQRIYRRVKAFLLQFFLVRQLLFRHLYFSRVTIAARLRRALSGPRKNRGQGLRPSLVPTL